MVKVVAALTIVAVLLCAPIAVAVGITALTPVLAATDCGTGDNDGQPGIMPSGGAGGSGWRPPVSGPYRLSSGYGPRLHPILRVRRNHTGQDLYGTAGPATVVAAAAGTVAAITGRDRAYGRMVTLRHPGGITTRYAHLAAIDHTIHPGRPVRAGQRLGREGSSGLSTGRHLHFEVAVTGRTVNPRSFLADRGVRLDGKSVPVRPDRTRPTTRATAGAGSPGAMEGGVGFPLPPPGTPRRNSLRNPPLPIPARIQRLYKAAAARYKIPWTLLAGIGMEETGHGRVRATSSAGARGLMQFLPATWSTMGVDGDGDAQADIDNDADSIFSAANYLTRSGVSHGTAGLTRALHAYNPAAWYRNDVLYYAQRYGGGLLYGDPQDCSPTSTTGNPALPPVTDDRIRIVLAWAQAQVGKPYRMGADGPDAYDCSSFTRTAYATISISLPRVASAQRSWLAAGNGRRITPGHEQPGDLVFWDSYLGPNQIGHVMIVWNPRTRTTIEAHNRRSGIGHHSYAGGPRHHIYEIWRVGNVTSPR